MTLPSYSQAPPALEGRGLCGACTLGSWNLRGHFRMLPPTSTYDIAMLVSIFNLIAGLTFKNKAEAGPWGGLLPGVAYVAAFPSWHSRLVVASWASGLTLREHVNAFAEIAQGWKLSSQFRKGWENLFWNLLGGEFRRTFNASKRPD